MKIYPFILVLFVLSLYSPTNSQESAPPAVSSANLGKRITVEGRAINRKGGTQLVGIDFAIWIDNLNIWPKGYYSGGDKGKQVRASGILAEDHGLPVFIFKENKPPIQGIPVPEGTDLKKASHRWILKDAVWELVSE